MSNIYFTISGMVYVILLQTVFFKHKKKAELGNKVYNWLIDSSAFGVAFELLCNILLNVLHIDPYSNAYLCSIRLVIIYYISWILLFTLYIWIIAATPEVQKNRFHRGTRFVLIVFLIFILFVSFTPVQIANLGNGIYKPTGVSVEISYTLSYVCVISMAISLIRAKSELKSEKFIPVYCFFIFGMFVLIVQQLVPGVYLLTTLEVFTTFIIYFTLENPDIKLIEEFNKTRDNANVSNEEKEMFLYNIIQGMSTPLNNIKDTCNELSAMKLNPEVDKGVNYLYGTCKQVYDAINEMKNITDKEACDIKINNAKYNPLRLIDELAMGYGNLVSDQVKFKLDISSNIPEALYGDSIRIKQVIKILLDNSIKYTNKGQINFSVTPIIKGDICRLYIKVTDTGVGMTSSELGHIFSKGNNIDENIDETRSNLIIAKTISSLLNGLLMVNSELDKGSTFTFVIDQKIVK